MIHFSCTGSIRMRTCQYCHTTITGTAFYLSALPQAHTGSRWACAVHYVSMYVPQHAGVRTPTNSGVGASTPEATHVSPTSTIQASIGPEPLTHACVMGGSSPFQEASVGMPTPTISTQGFRQGCRIAPAGNADSPHSTLASVPTAPDLLVPAGVH